MIFSWPGEALAAHKNITQIKLGVNDLLANLQQIQLRLSFFFSQQPLFSVKPHFPTLRVI
jgi:hypothetical protein